MVRKANNGFHYRATTRLVFAEWACEITFGNHSKFWWNRLPNSCIVSANPNCASLRRFRYCRTKAPNSDGFANASHCRWLLVWHSPKSFIAGIHRASKHKILPNQNAVFVTFFIKDIFCINSAAPNPQHIHIGINCIFDYRLVHRIGGTWQKLSGGMTLAPFINTDCPFTLK